jgi:hypothetical protein
MKNVLSTLFRWQPSCETLTAMTVGVIVVGLSASRILVGKLPWLSIIIRDIGQIFIIGILFPLAHIRHTSNDFARYGLTLKKWYVFLPINLVLGVLLLFQFLSNKPPSADFRLNGPTIWAAYYVILALCFEFIFFYAFLRTLLVRAFGALPAIAMTALFYSFHHIGFQPEYSKLFFVGLIYATTYHLGNSFLLIFPFFLGVGGTYDVLIQSKAVSPILHPEIRVLFLAVLILGTVVWTWKKPKVHSQK